MTPHFWPGRRIGCQSCCKGTKEVMSIEIKDEIDTDDINMIQDLIIAALNDAFRKVDREMEETLGSLAQGMKFPGLF